LSWAKLDDRFWMHPKVTAIGNEGAGVFARMLSFCGCYLTNGLVSPEAVKTICPNRKLLERMNDLDVIELRESGAVYIRDYLDYNHDRDKVEAERDAAKARMRSRRRNGVRSCDGSLSWTPHGTTERVHTQIGRFIAESDEEQYEDPKTLQAVLWAVQSTLDRGHEGMRHYDVERAS
jgi:hypothetical protein